MTWSPAINPVGTIDSYIVTAAPGGAAARVPAAAKVALVPGLTNGTNYRFSVRGSNGVGLGPESAPSEEVVPTLASVATPPPVDTVPADVPVVMSVASRGGPVTGGPEVVVTGKSLATVSAVRFVDPPLPGGAPGASAAASAFQVISDHQIGVTFPPQAAPGRGGRVTLVVTNSVGDSASDAAGAWFHYGTGGWTTTGSTSYPAPGVPALLPGGQILTVAAGTPSTAAVFEPASGIWQDGEPAAADPKGANRPVLTVTLPIGKVLTFRSHDVFGRSVQAQCQVGVSDIRTACTDPNVPQVYDHQASGPKWQTIAPKATAASGPALLLDDDRVLVAGGCCQEQGRSNAGISAVEIYDPSLASGTWLPVQPLPLPLVDHTLTLMHGTPEQCGTNCSKVLAAGGFKRRASTLIVRFTDDNQVPLPPPAIFDPVSNTWRTTRPMNAPRYGHGAVELPGGKVMVVGGSIHIEGPIDPGPSTTPALATATTEVFDPLTESWSYAAPMATRRYRPATLMLSDGRVLVAGGFSPTGPVADAEIYDPVKNQWSPAGALSSPGSAQLIELPTTGTCGSNCGRVLAIRDDGTVDTFVLPPTVLSLSKATGPITGNTELTITGTRFTPESRVFFGGVPAATVEVLNPTTIEVTTPPGVVAKAPVTVGTDGGTAKAPEPFSYTGAPGAVRGLAARAVSSRDIELSFRAAGSVGDAGPAAERYVVRQSRAPITEANFDTAPSLCGGICDDFVVNEVGEVLRLAVGKLTPGTRYHYAVAALGADDVMGPIATATAETLSVPSEAVDSELCGPTEASHPDQVRYESGYSLMGLPSGTVSRATAVFGWFNLGSGNRYSVEDPGAGVEAGHGYWGWFACPTTVQLAAGTDEVQVPLGRYRASIVGNPATRPAELSGHDFAARWDPALNSATGGYRISGFQETTTLEVGEGAWAFSYRDTSLVVRAR
ncbi:MAG TPA: IPT/TIG domain-containing protein [Acidimicrobiales bacterium]|nr:IPT/TIG domain-containing protein [Acidimicrobiales bacterium]